MFINTTSLIYDFVNIEDLLTLQNKSITPVMDLLTAIFQPILSEMEQSKRKNQKTIWKKRNVWGTRWFDENFNQLKTILRSIP
jgi:hypothetical protein